MEIKSIKHLQENVSNITSKEKVKDNLSELPKKEQISDYLQLSDWQKKVLQIAQNYLANKDQVENSQTSNLTNYKQIQTLEEALEEIKQMDFEKNKEVVRSTQANLSPEDVLKLFVS